MGFAFKNGKHAGEAITPEVVMGAHLPALSEQGMVRPPRIDDATWELIRDYDQYGGLFDLREEICKLQAYEGSIENDAALDTRTRFYLLAKLTETRARLKREMLNMQMKKQHVLTFDIWAAFLEDLITAIKDEVGGDLILMMKLGKRIEIAAERVERQMRSAA